MTLVDRATSALVDHRTAVVSAARLAERLGKWASAEATLAASLADGIARLVREGELRGGDRLPSERTLAATVSVSRGTVVSAYARLYEDGILDRRQGSGTRVAGTAPSTPRQAAGRGEALYASLSSNIDLLRAVPAISPRAIDIVNRHRPVLDATTVEADPAGLPALRDLIARTMTDDGTATTPAQVLVTHGGQQALSLLIDELVSPGDTVLTEHVSWPGLTDAVRRRGGRVHGIRLTPDGIDVDELEAAIVVRRPVLIALNPHNHNPTGIQTEPAVRQRVADLAAEYGITLIEDRVLAHLSYDGATPPSLAALRPDAPIVVVDSLSKWAWEGLRVGWMRADPVLVRRLRGLRQTTDLSTSVPSQLLALDLLAEAPALRRDAVVAHREAAVKAGALLAAHLPDWRWRAPRGGLCIWARMPTGSASAFARHAAAFGVSVAGSMQFSSDVDTDDHIRIPITSTLLENGLERLGEAWDRYRSSSGA
ncbi:MULTISPECIES: PLP-dependent aminotransferase family protein [Microbacterium]|uniref:aminotransferase-like domain-containing protein n=1 Tax=Microbacterium TaxID=33882 RepID=UPI002786195F|nr:MULTISPECIES: PLP-dependent aminotransferase family protein [Microbacterium]MDQ1083584.1 DNA-binding transcriptional MocR family regulator [Microbacterium sp. SORGH_AS_0344]MDQ1171140.1 DNA-binding transcriptional MocR family regulator [Microbacterium proteolyticum]